MIDGKNSIVIGLSKELGKEAVRRWIGEGLKVFSVYPGSLNAYFFDHVAGVDFRHDGGRPKGTAKPIVALVENHPDDLSMDVEPRSLTPKREK